MATTRAATGSAVPARRTSLFTAVSTHERIRSLGAHPDARGGPVWRWDDEMQRLD